MIVISNDRCRQCRSAGAGRQHPANVSAKQCPLPDFRVHQEVVERSAVRATGRRTSGMIDQIVDIEDRHGALPEDGADPSPESAARAVRRALRGGTSPSRSSPPAPVPVFRSCSMPLRNWRPIRRKPRHPSIAVSRGPHESLRHFVPDDSKHVLAHVFKVIVDPFISKLGVFRSTRAPCAADSQLFGQWQARIQVAHLYRLHGKGLCRGAATGAWRYRRAGSQGRRRSSSIACCNDSHDEDHRPFCRR